jgi:hypothetical protein
MQGRVYISLKGLSGQFSFQPNSFSNPWFLLAAVQIKEYSMKKSANARHCQQIVI